MLILYFIIFAVIAIFGFKVFMKRWNSSNVDQRLEDVKDRAEIAEKIEEVDTDKARKDSKNINDFMEETQDQ